MNHAKFNRLLCVTLPANCDNRSLEGKPVTNLQEFFNKITMNVIWQLATGERYGYSDIGMARLLSFNDAFMQLAITLLAGPVAAFPILA